MLPKIVAGMVRSSPAPSAGTDTFAACKVACSVAGSWDEFFAQITQMGWRSAGHSSGEAQAVYEKALRPVREGFLSDAENPMPDGSFIAGIPQLSNAETLLAAAIFNRIVHDGRKLERPLLLVVEEAAVTLEANEAFRELATQARGFGVVPVFVWQTDTYFERHRRLPEHNVIVGHLGADERHLVLSNALPRRAYKLRVGEFLRSTTR